MKPLRCIVCGRVLKDNKEGMVCEACKKSFKKYDKKIKRVVFCRECFRYKKNKAWETPSRTFENIGEYLSYIFNIPSQEISKIKNNVYEYKDEISNVIYIINIGYGICDECSRQKGGYYESIIQLRGDNNFVEEMKINVEKFVSSSSMPRSFISKIENTKGGIDIYIGSKKITKKFIKTIKNKKEYIIKYSNSLYGIKDGKPVSRDVYLIKNKKGENIVR